MSKQRIGDLLIERGLIDRTQLKRALRAQLIFGGHIGTNLIELEYIDEHTLGQSLAELHGVRHATTDRLIDIPPSAINAISPELVEKYMVVPFDLDERTLHLAVIDPKKLTSLSRQTGYKIVPWIGPEIRIFQALEKYYGIPQRPRYITICNELDRTIDKVRPAASGARRSARRKTDVKRPPMAAAGVASATGSEMPPPLAATTNLVDMGEKYGYGKSWREIVGQVFGGEGSDAAVPAQQEPVETPEPVEGDQPALTGKELARRLSHIESKDELGTELLDHVARSCDACVLFGVQGEVAQIWDWRGLGFDPVVLRKLRFPVTSGSVFTLLLGNEYYRGEVGGDPGCRTFYASLRIDPPAEVLLIPVHLGDRLVAVLYAHGKREGGLEGETEEYLRIKQRLALALQMMILRMKMLSI
jgi:hypothetical protein